MSDKRECDCKRAFERLGKHMAGCPAENTSIEALLAEIDSRAEKAKPNNALVGASFKKNERDYWDGFVQFGGDPELRLLWFHGVGYDDGFKAGRARSDIPKLVRALRVALEQRNRECYSNPIGESPGFYDAEIVAVLSGDGK